MSADTTISHTLRARETALRSLAVSAAANIPGVDFASITLRGNDQTAQTIVATDPLAEETDALQYALREGPCYAAVTDERLLLVNDVATTAVFPQYGPLAAGLGVRSQAAIQLTHNGVRAGLNLYSHSAEAFGPSTVLWAELFAAQVAAWLNYAIQVEQLGEALHTRTDIGTAVGILMERYSIDRNRAFAFLTRNSQNRNIKVATWRNESSMAPSKAHLAKTRSPNSGHRPHVLLVLGVRLPVPCPALHAGHVSTWGRIVRTESCATRCRAG